MRTLKIKTQPTFTFSIILVFLFLFSGRLAGQGQTYENLFDYNKGARVVAYSSNYGSVWDVEYVLANCPFDVSGSPVWCTAQNAPFPHFVTIELKNPQWLNIIEFNNAIPDENSGWEGISAKDVEVYVSTVSKDQGFVKVVDFRLEPNRNIQIVKISPVQARWVKFVITSNYGHEEYTEFGQIGVYDDKQRNGKIIDDLNTKGFVDLYGIYFDFGSDVLKSESQIVIEQIADYMKSNPAIAIQVEGHTDNVGTDSANQTLSDKRASAVKRELVKEGVAESRLTTKGFGSKQPVASNESTIGRAQNRRVTIRKI
jgi:outer membrane protein OmpA-like peptidoglycan-associated protein